MLSDGELRVGLSRQAKAGDVLRIDPSVSEAGADRNSPLADSPKGSSRGAPGQPASVDLLAHLDGHSATANLAQSTNFASILRIARAAARRLQSKKKLSRTIRVRVCLSLLSGECLPPALEPLRCAIRDIPVDEQHYWAGTLYTLLLPPATRRSQATYFTPPRLAEAVIDLAISAGFDLARHRVLDPAAGGAAFLSTIAGRRAALGGAAASATSMLRGIEIDPGLAEVSRALIAARLGVPVRNSFVRVGDALTASARSEYDLVIANPPYGRISPSDVSNKSWEGFAYAGHLNKYALFADLSIRFAKRGGLVALVIPSSVRAGPLYDKLRAHIRKRGQILTVGSLADRDGIFADVAQDVSVILMRKGDAHDPSLPVQFPVLPSGPPSAPVSKLPLDIGAPWPTPTVLDDKIGGATLADYQVTVRAGYFVWNRESHRFATKSSRRAYPLIWAKNVRAGSFCRPAGKAGGKVNFVTFDSDSQAIVRGPAAVLQRTTNDKQARRLVAATVSPSVVRTWGGFVTENHTIVITGRKLADVKLVVALLNTKAVDNRYRRVSGTAAVSVTLLRSLDLPLPSAFRRALADTGGDAEAAAAIAYAQRNLAGG